MLSYQRWLDRPVAQVRRFEVEAERARAIIRGAMAEGRERLSVSESFEVLECYGIPVASYRIARDEPSVLQAAEDVGYPVVLKAVSQEIVHKTEAGAVKLDVRDPDAVRRAFGEIASALESESDAAREAGVLVQRLQKGGKETIVGMTMEPRFGPIVMFGLGGVYVEVLRDVAFRIQPVSTVDAEEMIHSLRGFPILEGVRGEPGVDLDKLAEVVERVSQMVGDHPEIQEMDINPFLAYPGGTDSLAVDARFSVGPEKRWERRP